MKKLLFIFTCLTLLFCLAACAEQQPDETDYYFYLDAREAPYKDGIFKIQEGKLGFFDLDSLEFQLLCNKEGCAHTDHNSCNALMPTYSSVFVNGDSLYTLETVWEDLRTDLVLRDMSGESKKIIASLDGVGYTSAVYVKSDVAYFSAESRDTKVPIEKAYLYSADLATGEFRCIMTADEGAYNSISLLGTYGDDLYMNYSYDHTAKSIAYDFTTQTAEECPEKVWRVYDDIMILMDDEKSVQIITPDKKVEIRDPEIINHTWFSPVVVNNYMISSGSGIAYDLDTCEIKDTHQCTLLAYYNGRYIVREADGSFLSMSPDEFFTKDSDPVI